MWEISILVKNRCYIDLLINTICRLNNLYVVFLFCLQLKNVKNSKLFREYCSIGCFRLCGNLNFMVLKDVFYFHEN